MLPKGIIQKIIEFYTSNEEFEDDIDRALKSFFDVNSLEEVENLLPDEMAEGLLNEWLVYDFKLTSGETLLQDFVRRNPLKLSEADLLLYHKLIDTNYYGYFEVKKVMLDEGLLLEDIVSGKLFDVKEKSATHELEINAVFYGRVAKVGENWELVGANAPYLPIQLTERVKDIFRKDPHPASPKFTYELIKNHKSGKDFKKEINPETARKRLTGLLKAHNLDEMVRVDTIVKWCEKAVKSNQPVEPVSLVFGLASEGLSPVSADVLIEAVLNVYNTTPKKELGNLSPQEKLLENPNYKPHFVTDIHPLGGKEWIDHCDLAHEHMQKQEYLNAVEEFKKTFAALLEETTTKKDIYRLFANKAVCHFACGEEQMGLKMLKLALDLNPNYDFAQSMFQRYQSGEYKHDILQGRLWRMAKEKEKPKRFSWRKWQGVATKKEIEADAAVKYYKYLKKLKINFVTKDLTQTEVRIYGAKGKVGRNDPCPCGSGKKYKKCHG